MFSGPGADRWLNGADVIVDYNTADPLIRWDSYQNICDGEGTLAAPRLTGLYTDALGRLGNPDVRCCFMKGRSTHGLV